MKINGQQPPEFQGVKGGSARESQNTKEPSSNVSGSKEPPIKTSNFIMNKMRSEIANEPEVRQEIVTELKAKIKSGEYKIDSESLAKTMLEDALKEDIS